MLRRSQWWKRLQKQSLQDKGNVTAQGLHVDLQVQKGHQNVHEAGAIIVRKIATVPVLTAS